ncbi:MAG: diguanylate cyclase [Gammaproteobacteria bacterium]|nr:diguanylate cyclase [Gammaproteobacteria bacterium]
MISPEKIISDKLNQLKSENLQLQESLTSCENRCNYLATIENILKITREHISILDSDYIYCAVSHSYLNCHNKSSEQIIGHTVDELLGKQVFEDLVKPNLERCFGGHTVNYQAWFNFNNLGQRYMDVTYYPIQETCSSETRHIVVSSHDLTELYNNQSDQRLAKSLFDNTSEGIVITDSKGIIVNVNSAFTQISGYQKQEVVGVNANITRSDRHDQLFYQNMWKSLKETGQWQGEIWDKHKSGHIYPKSLSINKITDDNGRVINYVGIFSDITLLKESQNQLEKLAYFDMLTQLPNRTHFFETLEHELLIAERNNQSFAIFFIDLDGFKAVNDNLGHNSGDLLLKQVATRLKKSVRSTDFIARLGGDEFTTLLLNTNDIQQITKIAKNIIATLSNQFYINQEKVKIGASIGIFCYPKDGDTIHSILTKADKAMYKAKKNGKGCYCFTSNLN